MGFIAGAGGCCAGVVTTTGGECSAGNSSSQAVKCWATQIDRWMRFSKPKLSS